MSFLYPLFLAGVAAIGLPILLHMIRRHTRNRVTFSSLMFLHTTMPRFRNRSRIEKWPLLILRCLIVCLLALAFARPFFPAPIEEGQGRLGRRTVLLVDTSASMQRPGMWAQAITQAQSALRDADPTDRVCIMSFDREAQTLMGFEQWQALDLAQRTSTAMQHLSELSPSWAVTNLGSALVAAAEAIEDDEINSERQPIGSRRIVLVSDLQQGSNLDALRSYEWPAGLTLTVEAVPSPGATNAALHLLTNRDPLAGPGPDDRPRVRVTNSSGAATEQFQLHWADAESAGSASQTVDVYLPPGNSAVVPAPDGVELSAARRLVLSGDDQDFDNTLYLAPHLKQQIDILYLGSDDPNDPQDMLYYLRQAFSATGATEFRVTSRSGREILAAADIEASQLIVAADAIASTNLGALRRYAEQGRTLLLVMKSAETAGALARLAGADGLECREAEVDRYAMLSRLEFGHPLLAPFSDPRFGDFTRIHFWKYRRVDLANQPTARVLAWFDSGDPAWFEIPAGRGTVLVLTCGWHPADSDLALSSKFVPLLYSVLDYSGVLTGQQLQYFVGDPVPLPSGVASSPANVTIRKPDRSTVTPDVEQQVFTQTDLPGIYSMESPAGATSFAVNLAPSESRTDPMPVEDLENQGVVLSSSVGPALADSGAAAGAKRVKDLVEMEYQQKLWRWVLVVVLAALLAETWLAGWLTRARPESQEQ